jgi:hypothetical protein
MVKSVIAGLLAILMLSPAGVFARDKGDGGGNGHGESYTIMDKNHFPTGYIRDGKVYDKSWLYQGYLIRDDKEDDREYRQKGYLSPEKPGKEGRDRLK